MKNLCEEKDGFSEKSIIFVTEINRERRLIMARAIRETPVLYGKDAERFEKEMKRVESLSPEERKANREKLRQEAERIKKKWNLTFVGCKGW